ncbi:MAG: hypothetical protein IKO47_02220 [Ruminococcus sp.]|nr:hypothetical protein [Ruminococcus sp.]
MRGYSKNRTYLIVSAAFVIWSAVIAATIILCGDDIIWTLRESRNDVIGSNSVNGRYFTNIITFAAVRSYAFRTAVAFVFLVLLHQLLLRVINTEKGVHGWAAALSAAFILTIPTAMFTQTINWISGITNYVISAVLLLSYLLYCKPLLCGKKLAYGRALTVVPLFIGFLGALCVENVTIYSLMFGTFIIIYSCKIFGKPHPGTVLYLAGAVGGSVLMFTNHTYSSLFGGGSDDIGFRKVQLDFTDMFHQIYEDLMSYYCVAFWIIHAVICVSFLIMYSDKFGGERGEPQKYAVPALTVVILYTCYSFFTDVVGGFAVWNASLTMRAIETAFTFVYLLSLLYLGWVLCTKQGFVRFTLYIVSTAILSAPFAVANPVTERCFFTDYIFWALAAGELSCAAAEKHGLDRKYPVRLASAAAVGYLAFSTAYMCAWNKYTDVMRFNYIKKQVDEGKSTVEFIKLPYPYYAPRDELVAYKAAIDERVKDNNYTADETVVDISLRLGDELLISHDINVKIDEKNIVLISLYDYSLK